MLHLDLYRAPGDSLRLHAGLRPVPSKSFAQAGTSSLEADTAGSPVTGLAIFTVIEELRKRNIKTGGCNVWCHATREYLYTEAIIYLMY